MTTNETAEEPSSHTYLTDESFLEGPLQFKGVDIPPLSYGRRACILSVVDLLNPQFFDIAGFLYGCVCPEMEIISAKRDVAKWDKAVYRWINKVKFEVSDSQEALAVITALLDLSEKNKVVPAPKSKDLDYELERELEADPNE
jgi:hypothetical protein